MISLQLIDVKKPVFLKSIHLKNCLKDLILREKKITGDISIVLTTDEYVLKVNQDFLQHDYYTDIITFDYCEGNVVSGDLVISLDRVKENSHIQLTSIEEELFRVIYHGVLHLCGYGDKTENEIFDMRAKEAFYLNLFVSRETKGE
ncbi:MAG: rRNA maturation RNase YbeY [Crocinitomicaceae bacterium]|jgi:probable rRNA maturation factor|nr:rRNA maturation RNase YbeY [Crocinitomicaceae bacterium]